jgi:uncharacterized Rmd1/YagE family protein
LRALPATDALSTKPLTMHSRRVEWHIVILVVVEMPLTLCQLLSR